MPTWKCLLVVLPAFRCCTTMVIGEGRNTAFWLDHWMGSGRAMLGPIPCSPLALPPPQFIGRGGLLQAPCPPPTSTLLHRGRGALSSVHRAAADDAAPPRRRKTRALQLPCRVRHQWGVSPPTCFPPYRRYHAGSSCGSAIDSLALCVAPTSPPHYQLARPRLLDVDKTTWHVLRARARARHVGRGAPRWRTPHLFTCGP